MALKDDLKKAINGALHEVYPMQAEDSFGQVLGVILDRVWGTLEDVVGSAQEALFQQLTAVRAELDAARKREGALRDTVRELSEALHVEETDDE